MMCETLSGVFMTDHITELFVTISERNKVATHVEKHFNFSLWLDMITYL